MIQPFQQRVIDEKTELDIKLAKLRDFFNTDIFADIPDEEKLRMDRQCNAMADYSEIPGERIAAFTS